MRKKVYSISENGVELMKGYARDIKDNFGIKQTMLTTCANTGQLARKKYKIVCLGEDGQTEYIPPKPKQSVEDIMNYLISHIKLYGNVSCTKEQTQYIGALKERGFDCDVSEFSVKVVEDSLVMKAQRGRTRKDYVITWLNYGGAR